MDTATRPEFIAAVIIASMRRLDAARDARKRGMLMACDVPCFEAQCAWIEVVVEATLDEVSVAYDALSRMYPLARDGEKTKQSALKTKRLYDAFPAMATEAMESRRAMIRNLQPR